MQKAFFKVLRFATHWPFDSLLCSSSRGQALRRKEKVSLFLYPALTSQHGARTAPRWLDVLGYSMAAPAGAGVSLV